MPWAYRSHEKLSVNMTMSSESEAEERYTRGRQLLARLSGRIGEEGVDGLGDLGRYVVEFVLGDVFSRPGLSLRDRELITVAMLAALGRYEPQLDLHMRGALNVGVTADELREVIIHASPYAGFPAAITAMRRLQALESSLTESAST